MPGSTFSDPVAGSPSFTGRLFRALLSALAGGGGTRVFGASSGVRPSTPSSIVSVTSTTWTVGAHAGYLDTSSSGTDGATAYAFLTAQTGGVTAADGSNDRVDLLCVQLSDPSEGDGTAAPQALIVYQAGTPGAGVPTNAVPRSFVLAQINVPQLTHGSPTVTWVAPRVVAAGGIRPVSGVSQYPSSPYVGQYIDDASLGLLRWNGTAWSAVAPGSGWHSLALDGGFNDTGGSAGYRVDGVHGYLRGRIAKNLGTNFVTGTGIEIAAAGAIPVSARPTRSMAYMCTTPAGAAQIRVTVGVDGSVTLYTTDTTADVVDLAGAGGWFVDS